MNGRTWNNIIFEVAYTPAVSHRWQCMFFSSTIFSFHPSNCTELIWGNKQCCFDSERGQDGGDRFHRFPNPSLKTIFLLGRPEGLPVAAARFAVQVRRMKIEKCSIQLFNPTLGYVQGQLCWMDPAIQALQLKISRWLKSTTGSPSVDAGSTAHSCVAVASASVWRPKPHTPATKVLALGEGCETKAYAGIDSK